MLLPQLTRHDVTIAALCDTDARPPCREPAARYGVAPENALRDWRELLERGDIDAVGLAVGPQGHLEIGLAADRAPPAGLHGEAAGADRRAGAAARAMPRQQHGVPVVVGFMKRYSTANRIASNIVALGGIRAAGELPRPVHDGADLFREGSRL